MKELEELDIGLLYKSLVLLGEDRQAEEVQAPVEDEKEVAARPPKKPKPMVNPMQNWEAALICPIPVKLAIERSDSNMRKILEALELSDALTHILPAEKLRDPSWLNDLKAVWFVGLDAQKERLEKDLKIPYLFSSDPEKLMKVEDKRAMFEPLKAFAPELKRYL